MTLQEKLEWAKRAFEEIAQDCEEIANLDIVAQDRSEQNTWKGIARTARRNIQILNQD